MSKVWVWCRWMPNFSPPWEMDGGDVVCTEGGDEVALSTLAIGSCFFFDGPVPPILCEVVPAPVPAEGLRPGVGGP